MDKKTPTPSYEVDWHKKPFKLRDEETPSVKDCQTYKYKDKESLASIAESLSRPWKRLTWQDLAAFNWGTSNLGEVNYYLEKCCGCKKASDDGLSYSLTATDAPGMIWVPNVRRKPSIRFRSPSQQDIGHVALDDETKQHINTLVIPPVYAIELELGDIDALFEPLPTPIGNQPWKLMGVQQRLQAIGCLYQPLGMSTARCDKAAEECWKYYKDVHTRPDPKDPNKKIVPSDDDLKAILMREVRNNIVSLVGQDHITGKAQILRGGLPRSGAETGAAEDCAMIRLPGGYRNCWPRAGADKRAAEYFTAPNATDADAKYDFNMSGDRFAYEKHFYADNALLGKVPLVATVWRQKLNGKWGVAEGVSVYFQLVDPTPPDKNPLRAPALRDKEMSFDKDWKKGELDYTNYPAGVAHTSPATWVQVKAAALAAMAAPNAQEKDRIIKQHVEATFSFVHPYNRRDMKTDIEAVIAFAQGHRAPYVRNNVGPKLFVDRVTAPAKIGDAAKDPQRYNCPKTYGGKRGETVDGEPEDGNVFVYIFETGAKAKRAGFHTPRGKDHADYGTLQTAEGVTPTGDDHRHAVCAVTNAKGHAGVIFAPSRMGGDIYRIRAYVGPPTLEFDGTDPKGPVAETGTMTVWRNIRLCGYYRRKTPRGGDGTPSASNAVKGLFNNTPNSPVKTWANAVLNIGNDNLVDPKFKKGEVSPLARNSREVNGAFNDNYRPINVDFLSLVDVFRRAYCELILDASGVSELTDAQYTRAMESVRDRAGKSREVGKDVDWDYLLVADNTSPWFVTLRSRKNYNDGRDAGTAPHRLQEADMPSVATALLRHGIRGVGETLTRHGHAPGVTILHLGALSNHWLVWEQHPGGGFLNYAGIGMANGIAILAGACPVEESYSIEGLAAHEGGHCLFEVHAPPVPAANVPRTHQENPATECMCIMSYRGCYGDFCGRCVMMLRGWHSRRDGVADADGV